MNMDRHKYRAWFNFADDGWRMVELDGFYYDVYGNGDPSIVICVKDDREYEGVLEECVLLQCTGLKDSEGNLIWEGDVLHHTYCDITDGEGNALGFDYVVIWKDKTACFALKQIPTGNEMEIIMDYKDLTGRTEKVVILGNIYEHKHLLEADEK